MGHSKKTTPSPSSPFTGGRKLSAKERRERERAAAAAAQANGSNAPPNASQRATARGNVNYGKLNPRPSPGEVRASEAVAEAKLAQFYNRNEPGLTDYLNRQGLGGANRGTRTEREFRKTFGVDTAGIYDKVLTGDAKELSADQTAHSLKWQWLVDRYDAAADLESKAATKYLNGLTPGQRKNLGIARANSYEPGLISARNEFRSPTPDRNNPNQAIDTSLGKKPRQTPRALEASNLAASVRLERGSGAGPRDAERGTSIGGQLPQLGT